MKNRVRSQKLVTSAGITNITTLDGKLVKQNHSIVLHNLISSKGARANTEK
jgi:hypothetical protein